MAQGAVACSLCIIENTCTQVRLVTDRELSDPAFIRRLRDYCFALNISSYHWLDFLTDQYRDLRGCIVDHTGRTVFLDMEVFEVPHKHAETHRSKQMRPLQTPDEVLNARPDTAFIFTDSLQHPILAQRKAYYAQSFMAGRFHPNPYHPPRDRVAVTLGLGRSRWLQVRQDRVPSRFAHFPQYASGQWSVLR